MTRVMITPEMAKANPELVGQEKKEYELPPEGVHALTISAVQVEMNKLSRFKDEKTKADKYVDEIRVRFSLDGQKTSDGEYELTVMQFLNHNVGSSLKFLKADGELCVTKFAAFFENLFGISLSMDATVEDFDYEALNGVHAKGMIAVSKNVSGKEVAKLVSLKPPADAEALEFNNDRLPLVVKCPFSKE